MSAEWRGGSSSAAVGPIGGGLGVTYRVGKSKKVVKKRDNASLLVEDDFSSIG